MREEQRKKQDSGVMPRARVADLVVEEVGDEVLVYDKRRHRAHCLNRSAAYVWRHCDGRTTAAEVSQRLGAELKAPVGAQTVGLALRELERADLLAESLAEPEEQGQTMSRRAMLAKIGLAAAAAAAVPIVTSIVAPTPAQAGSRLGSGASCTTSAQCQSDLCAGGYCT